jgi:hypothetical protein
MSKSVYFRRLVITFETSSGFLNGRSVWMVAGEYIGDAPQ